eukprot:CAMPEP_0113701932 /NCGR_PEP_ID=MMETSP0038_2-20120614/24870_1 /TAXON_ID=2898 /ORGANISM="Cryptomonas paramecium" /LENGTH=131 /DNA_ID=CAMNT_0000625921 /DNA_START=54 /DNA_END=446 /DNA_ORIENTATION=- /assembly_acc=CAM_ASM_000170
MTDPVMTEEGFTYDRKSIEAWFAKKGPISPTSGAALSSMKLTPNQSIRSLISKRHPHTVLSPFTAPARQTPATEVVPRAPLKMTEYLRLLFGGGAFDDQFGDPATLPLLRSLCADAGGGNHPAGAPGHALQ